MQMKKKVLFVLVLFMVVGIAGVFAFTTGTYGIPDTDITMEFRAMSSTTGNVSLSSGGSRWNNAGTYRVDGNRLIIRLGSTNDRVLKELNNKNLELRIAENGDIYDGSARWVRL
jgi:lipopolysaccharide export LptBFGC system permease protein LptF